MAWLLSGSVSSAAGDKLRTSALAGATHTDRGILSGVCMACCHSYKRARLLCYFHNRLTVCSHLTFVGACVGAVLLVDWVVCAQAQVDAAYLQNSRKRLAAATARPAAKRTLQVLTDIQEVRQLAGGGDHNPVYAKQRDVSLLACKAGLLQLARLLHMRDGCMCCGGTLNNNACSASCASKGAMRGEVLQMHLPVASGV